MRRFVFVLLRKAMSFDAELVLVDFDISSQG